MIKMKKNKKNKNGKVEARILVKRNVWADIKAKATRENKHVPEAAAELLEQSKELEELLIDMGVFENEREKGNFKLWKNELLGNATTRGIKELAEKIIERIEEFERT